MPHPFVTDFKKKNGERDFFFLNRNLSFHVNKYFAMCYIVADFYINFAVK